MQDRVSIKMIAQKLGVSIATVSLALRRRGPISEQTAEKIRETAKQMGYQPSPLLASLAARRFRSEAAVQGTPIAIFDFPTLRGEPARTGFPKRLATEAQRLGYAPEIYTFPRAASKQSLIRELHHRMVPGIIVAGSIDTEHLSKEFDWSQFSVVQCGRCQSVHNFHMVRPNIFQAVKLAFQKLSERGYQRIGCAFGRHGQPVEDDEARFGAAVALERSCMPKMHQLPIYQGLLNDERALLKWAKMTKPDVVLGFSSAFLWSLRNAGYDIPSDLGFASMHLAEVDRSWNAAGLYQRESEIALQSVLLLDQLITSRERGLVEHPLNILVPSAWHDGSTIRPMGTEPPLKKRKRPTRD